MTSPRPARRSALRAIAQSLLVCLASLFAPDAKAEPIPGADDPALQRAAMAWLSAETSTEALHQIGTLAVDGNIAARHLANLIFAIHLSFEFPHLSRSERRELFPADPSGRTFQPYWLERSDVVALAALDRMREAATAEDWIAAADIALAAGLRRRVLDQLRYDLPSRPDINIEIALAFEDILDPDDREMSDLWFFFLFEQELRTAFPDATRAARLAGPAWNDARERRFLAALSEDRWSALRVAAAMSLPDLFDVRIPISAARADQLRRLGAIAQYARFETDHPAPSPAEMEQLGTILLHDAERSLYLRPLRNACLTHCAASAPDCMARGVLAGFDDATAFLSSLEPVIRPEDHFASPQSVAVLLGLVAHHQSDHWPLPVCLVDAARIQTGQQR